MATARESPAQSHLRTLISASHILHFLGVLDAYGHVSVRHPSKPDVFVMPRSIAPGTLSSEQDLVEYYIKDASSVSPSAPPGYAERHIHSEVYKKYADVQSVIHSHASAVIPYSISGVPLRPCYHMAGFLGNSTPVFDIAKFYTEDDKRNLLVSSGRLGEALATHFAESSADPASTKTHTDHSVVLMRGHGFTAVASSIEECVLRAVYTAENASIQTASLTLRSAHHTTSREPREIEYLREDEIEGATNMTHWSYLRPWNLWLQQVERSGFYTNSAAKIS